MSAEAVLQAVEAARASKGRGGIPAVTPRSLGRSGEVLARRLIDALGSPDSHTTDSVGREKIVMQMPPQPGSGSR